MTSTANAATNSRSLASPRGERHICFEPATMFVADADADADIEQTLGSDGWWTYPDALLNAVDRG